MENNKQERSALYKKKAIHQQKEKAERESIKSSGELDGIQDLNEQELIDFINNKYDKIISKNQQIYLPLNQAILSRIASIRSNTIQNAKRQLREFISSGQALLNKEQQEELFKENYLYRNISNKDMKNVKMIEVRIQNLRFMSVYIRTKTQNEERKLLFCGKMPANCHMEIDFKRFKKDCLYVLESIATFKETVFIKSNQKL